MAVTPIRLGSLSAVAPPMARARPRPQVDPDSAPSPFHPPEYHDVNLLSRRGDHVVAVVDGRIGEYAIGHLSDRAQAMLRSPGSVRASLADAKTRTMLGILSDKAFDDLHDPDPLVCPVALAVIRAHAGNAGVTLRHYIAAAPLCGDLSGQEFTRDQRSIVYKGGRRTLTVEWRMTDWNVLHDLIEVQHRLPDAALSSSVGQPLSRIVSHALLDGVDAVVTSAEAFEWGTEIGFQAKPLRARRLPEAGGRRMMD